MPSEHQQSPAAAIGAAAPDLKVAMKLTRPQVGLLAGTFFVAAGLSLPFAGRSVGRFGPTLCVLVGLAMACAVRSGPKERTGTCVGLVQSSSLIGSFALLWLPSLSVLLSGSTASGRALVGGAVFVLPLGVAHVLTWRLRKL